MITETNFKIGDQVDFLLENKYRIKGKVSYVGPYYTQVNPNTDKQLSKFGYSAKLLEFISGNAVKFQSNRAYIDNDVYKIVDNALEIEFNEPIEYNGTQLSSYTFREGYVTKNTIQN